MPFALIYIYDDYDERKKALFFLACSLDTVESHEEKKGVHICRTINFPEGRTGECVRASEREMEKSHSLAVAVEHDFVFSFSCYC
jgi:deoxyribose-phosphate aldolase